MYKVVCKESPFTWWFCSIDDLLDFCNTLIDNGILYSIALEQGNKATDWSPAPEYNKNKE